MNKRERERERENRRAYQEDDEDGGGDGGGCSGENEVIHERKERCFYIYICRERKEEREAA